MDVATIDITRIPDRVGAGCPRWVLETYEGMEKDIAEYIRSAVFHDRFANVERLDSPDAIARANAEAMTEAMGRTIAMVGALERAEVFQAMLADRLAIFKYLPAEYGTIQEWLTAIYGDLDGDDTRLVDMSFWVKTMLPKLERIGVPAEKVIGVPQQFSKARAATPLLRRAVETMDDEELKDYAEGMLTDISSDMSFRDFRDKIRGPVGGEVQKKEPFYGYEMMMAPDETWIIIKVVGDQKEISKRVRAIELMFGPLLDKRIVDALTVMQELGSRLLKSSEK